jgi:hypothetical protein
MSEVKMQQELWHEDTAFSNEPTTVNGWARRAHIIQEEIRLGDWDYDRLLPERKRYEEIKKEYSGVKTFTHRGNKFAVEEARSVVRFLNTWIKRRENLEKRLSQIQSTIQGML